MSADATPDPKAVATAIKDCLAARAPGATICPSEAARRLSPEDWRPLMPSVRAVAAMLAETGQARVTQKGVTVDATTARGPIRIGRP